MRLYNIIYIWSFYIRSKKYYNLDMLYHPIYCFYYIWWDLALQLHVAWVLILAGKNLPSTTRAIWWWLVRREITFSYLPAAATSFLKSGSCNLDALLNWFPAVVHPYQFHIFSDCCLTVFRHSHIAFTPWSEVLIWIRRVEGWSSA